MSKDTLLLIVYLTFLKKKKKRSFHREWPVGLPGKQLNFKPLEDIISSKIFNKASSFFVVIAVYLDNGVGMVLQQG